MPAASAGNHKHACARSCCIILCALARSVTHTPTLYTPGGLQTDLTDRIRNNNDFPAFDTVTFSSHPMRAKAKTEAVKVVDARYDNACLILLAIAHVSVAKSAADVYACVEETPGRWVLADNPEVVCFEGSWTR